MFKEKLTSQVIQSALFIPSWRSLNPLKGSLNHPKKVTLNHQVFVLLKIKVVPLTPLELKHPHKLLIDSLKKFVAWLITPKGGTG